MDWGSADLFGKEGIVGNILGGLGTVSQIYGLYNQSQQNDRQYADSQATSAANLAENKRQFDLKYQMEQAGMAQSAEAAAGAAGLKKKAIAAQIQAAHSRAVEGAYNSLIQAVETGRGGEAASLAGLVDRIQKAYAQR